MGNRKAREYQKRQDHASAWESAQADPRGIAEDVCLPGIGLRRLQLVVAPSFAQGYSWDVRSLGSVWRLFRSEVIREPYYAPISLQGYTELEASGQELQGLVLRLRSLSLSIAPPAEDIGGVDGTTYHLALCGDYGSEARFRWWEEPPSNWRPLGDIAAEMIARFISLAEKDG